MSPSTRLARSWTWGFQSAVTLGARVPVGGLLPERRARHAVDLARAYAAWNSRMRRSRCCWMRSRLPPSRSEDMWRVGRSRQGYCGHPGRGLPGAECVCPSARRGLTGGSVAGMSERAPGKKPSGVPPGRARRPVRDGRPRADPRSRPALAHVVQRRDRPALQVVLWPRPLVARWRSLSWRGSSTTTP
jgi:hypothetical protein